MGHGDGAANLLGDTVMRAWCLLVAATFALIVGCTPGYVVPSSGNSGFGAFTVTSNGATVSSVSLVVGTNGSSTITVTESGYTGNFTASSSNASVVTVSAAATAASRTRAQSAGSATSSGAFTLIAVGGGTATITFSDTLGHSSSVQVGVTDTSGVVF
jgi:hypothetical protein